MQSSLVHVPGGGVNTTVFFHKKIIMLRLNIHGIGKNVTIKSIY